jgi:hypothetical protein
LGAALGPDFGARAVAEFSKELLADSSTVACAISSLPGEEYPICSPHRRQRFVYSYYVKDAMWQEKGKAVLRRETTGYLAVD